MPIYIVEISANLLSVFIHENFARTFCVTHIV